MCCLPCRRSCSPGAVRRRLWRKHVQRTLFWIAATHRRSFRGRRLSAVRADKRGEIMRQLRPRSAVSAAADGAAALVACVVIARPRRGLAAFGSVLACVLLVVSFWVNPVMDSARSGADFVHRRANVRPGAGAGIRGVKEQYLLMGDARSCTSAIARWREGEQEAADAARWLSSSAGRQLIVSAALQGSVLPADAADSLGAEIAPNGF